MKTRIDPALFWGSWGPEMTSKSLLDKLRVLCRHNLYEVIVENKNNGEKWRFVLNGPCGVLFRNNIIREWWNALVISPEETVFGVELQGSHTANAMSTGMMKMYPEISKSVCGRLPLGLAYYGKCMDRSSVLEDVPVSFASRTTVMIAQFYVSPRLSNQWFNKLQRQRLMWWKKYSRKPSALKISNIQNNEKTQSVDICYSFPSSDCVIETVRNCGDLPLRSLNVEYPNLIYQERDGQKSFVPFVVECISTLEAAQLSLLVDGFREESTAGRPERIVLGLHNRLTPFKVAITVSPESELQAQIKELVKYVHNELRKRCIPVFRASEMQEIPLEQQFIRFDEMGIPYCIVLNDSVLKNGIIGLRNRDTTLKEQVHISEISNRLVTYVQH